MSIFRFVLALVLFLFISGSMGMNSIQKRELHVGDCFIYKTTEGYLDIGFVLMEKKLSSKNEYSNLEFIPVKFKNSFSSVDDFKKGSIYSNQVGVGMNSSNSMLGIYVFHFYKEHLSLLDNFIKVGNLKLDKEKFMIGAGTSAPSIEKFFRMQLKNLDAILDNMKKIGIKEIL